MIDRGCWVKDAGSGFTSSQNTIKYNWKQIGKVCQVNNSVVLAENL